MSNGAATAVYDRDSALTRIASSAFVLGAMRVGERALVAEGAVIRSSDGAVALGAGSAVLENSVVVGTALLPTTAGRRSTFGHRCLVVGARRSHPART